MSKPKILIQLDTDPHASVFDGVVAADAGIDHLFQYGGVTLEQVRDLVHGAMFTRGPQDLHNTAIFVGGSDVRGGEKLMNAVTDCFFGPMRVSVLMDANGANTTAAAAVLAAARHLDLANVTALVLAATGPVGARAVRLLASQGAQVRVASRSLDRAEAVCEDVKSRAPGAQLAAVKTSNDDETAEALEGAELLIAAGAAGIVLVSEETRQKASRLQVAVDLNAVPPLGLEGVKVTDAGKERGSQICYGAIGVGGTKMKIHKAAVRSLFETNDQILDAEQVFALGQQLGG